MNKKILKLVPIIIFLFAGLSSSVIAQDGQVKADKLKSAKASIPGVENITLNPKTNRIAQIDGIISNTLNLRNAVDVETFLKSNASAFGLNENDTFFRVLGSEEDRLGMQHTKVQQLYKNVPVFGSEIILHTNRDGVVNRINGELIDNITTQDVAPSITAEQALQIAMTHSGGSLFDWQIPGQEASIKEVFGDQSRTLKPSPELVFAPKDGNFENTEFRLAYQLILPVNEPEVGNYRYIIDAKTGEVLANWSRLHQARKSETTTSELTKLSPSPSSFMATGSGESLYSGNVSISTDLIGGSYQLSDVGRNIKTYYTVSTSSLPGTIFSDTDNVWDDGSQRTKQGVEAHWGGAKVWDYLNQKFSRNSLNGSGMQIRATVDVQSGSFMPNNAFWNGVQIVFGRGNGTNYNPFTQLDVIAHEYGHGFTEFTSGLIYQAESGALNEAYSDILGISVDFFANPGANWLLGEAITVNGNGFRSMSNPNSLGYPDTYQGTYWVNTANTSSSNDNGGVHTNSSVANYMFYLLSVGGSGTNDNNDSYSVTGIGIDKAAQIWYRAQTTYLTASSNFAAARTATLNAAADLYSGTSSAEYAAVQDAWAAVGVGASGGTTPPPPTGGTTIFSDNFETGWGNWNDGGSDVVRYGATFVSGESYSIQLRDNSGSRSAMTSDGFNLTGYDAVELKFDFYALSLENGEDLWVRYNGGSGWQTVAAYVAGTHIENGVHYTATIALNSSQVTFGSNSQFRIQADASNNADYVYVDLVSVSASSSTSVINSLVATNNNSAFSPEVEGDETPVEFGLEQNYPNPFNPTTTISYSIATAGPVSLEIYNLAGQKVATVVSSIQSVGTHQVTFDASALSSGIYIYKLQSNGSSTVRKMTLLK